MQVAGLASRGSPPLRRTLGALEQALLLCELPLQFRLVVVRLAIPKAFFEGLDVLLRNPLIHWVSFSPVGGPPAPCAYVD